MPFTNHRAERAISAWSKPNRELPAAPRYAACCRISGYLQAQACQGYDPLVAIDIALNGNAANMVEKSHRDNPADQDQKQGCE